jgi:hypothetical protein
MHGLLHMTRPLQWDTTKCSLHYPRLPQHMLYSVQVYRSTGRVPVLGNPYFRFYDSYTPYIFGAVPHGIAPGDDVTLYGDFQWNMLNMYSYEPEDPRGYIREVKIGDFLYAFGISLAAHDHKLLGIYLLSTKLQRYQYT